MCFPEDLSLLSSRKCSLCLTRAEQLVQNTLTAFMNINGVLWDEVHAITSLKPGILTLRLYLDREERACWLATPASGMK